MSAIDRFKNPQQEHVRRMLEKYAKDKSISIEEIRGKKDFRKYFPDEKTATSALAFMTIGRFDAAIQMATYGSAKKNMHVVRVNQQTVSRVAQSQLGYLAGKKAPEEFNIATSDGEVVYSLGSFIPMVQAKAGGEVSKGSIQNYLLETFVGTARLFDDTGELLEGTNIDVDRFRTLIERNYAKDMIIPIDHISKISDGLSSIIFTQYTAQSELDQMLAEYSSAPDDQKPELAQRIVDARQRVMSSNAYIVDHITSLQTASKINQITASNVAKTIRLLDNVESFLTPEEIKQQKAELEREKDELEAKADRTEAENARLAEITEGIQDLDDGLVEIDNCQTQLRQLGIDMDSQQYLVHREAMGSYAGAINNFQRSVISENLGEYVSALAKTYSLDDTQAIALSLFFRNDNGGTLSDEQLDVIRDVLDISNLSELSYDAKTKLVAGVKSIIPDVTSIDDINLTKAKLQLILNYRKSAEQIMSDVEGSSLGILSVVPREKRARLDELLKNPSAFGLQGRQAFAYGFRGLAKNPSVLLNFIESYQPGCTGNPEDDMLIGMLRCASNMQKESLLSSKIMATRVDSLLDLNDMKILAGFSREEFVAKFEEIVPERALDVKNFITQISVRELAVLDISERVEGIPASDFDAYSEGVFTFNGKPLISQSEYENLKRATIVPNNEEASKRAFEEALRDKLIDEMNVELSHTAFYYNEETEEWAFINPDGSTSQIMEDLDFNEDRVKDAFGQAERDYEEYLNHARLKQTYEQYNQLLNDGRLADAKVLFNKMLEEAIADKDNFPQDLRRVLLSDPLAQETIAYLVQKAEKENSQKQDVLQGILSGEVTERAVPDGGAVIMELKMPDGTIVGPEIENLGIFIASSATARDEITNAEAKGLKVVNVTHGTMFQLPESITPEEFAKHVENLTKTVEKRNVNDLGSEPGKLGIGGAANKEIIIKALMGGQVFFPGAGTNNKNALLDIISKEFGLKPEEIKEAVGYFPIGEDAKYLEGLLEKSKDASAGSKDLDALKEMLVECKKPSWQRQKYFGKDTRIQPGKEAENEKKKKEEEKKLQQEIDKPENNEPGKINMGRLIYLLGNVDNVIDAAAFSAAHFQKSNALLAQHKTVQLSYPGLGMCEGGIHRDTTNSLYSKYQMTSDVQSFLRAPNGQLRFSESGINLAIGRIETYINKGALTPDALMHLMTTDKFLNVMGLNKDPEIYKSFMQELEDRGLIPPKTHTGKDINFEGKSEIERFEYSYNLKKNSKKYNFTLTEEQISKLSPDQQKQYRKDKDDFDKSFIQARVFSTDGAKIKPSEVAKLFEKGGPLEDASPAVRIWYNEKLKEAITTDQLGYYSVNDNRYVVPDIRTGGNIKREKEDGTFEVVATIDSIDALNTYLNEERTKNNGCLPADVLDKIPFDLIEVPGMTFELKEQYEKSVEKEALARIAQAKDPSNATYGMIKNSNGETVPYTVEDEIADRSKYVLSGPDALSKEERDWLIANQEYIDRIRAQKILLLDKSSAIMLSKRANRDEKFEEYSEAIEDMASVMADAFIDNYQTQLLRFKAMQKDMPEDRRIPDSELESAARDSAMKAVQDLYGNECVEGVIADKSAFESMVNAKCSKRIYMAKHPDVEKVDIEAVELEGELEVKINATKAGTGETYNVNKEDFYIGVRLNQPLLESGKKPEDFALYTSGIGNLTEFLNASLLERVVAKAEAPLIESIGKAKNAYYNGSQTLEVDGKTTENANGNVQIFCNNIMKDIKQEIKNISQIKDPDQRRARMLALEQVLHREGLIGFMQNNPNGQAMVAQLKAELALETAREHDGVDLDDAPEIEEIATEEDAIALVDAVVESNEVDSAKDLAELLVSSPDLLAPLPQRDRPHIDPVMGD